MRINFALAQHCTSTITERYSCRPNILIRTSERIMKHNKFSLFYLFIYLIELAIVLGYSVILNADSRSISYKCSAIWETDKSRFDKSMKGSGIPYSSHDWSGPPNRIVTMNKRRHSKGIERANCAKRILFTIANNRSRRYAIAQTRMSTIARICRWMRYKYSGLSKLPIDMFAVAACFLSLSCVITYTLKYLTNCTSNLESDPINSSRAEHEQRLLLSTRPSPRLPMSERSVPDWLLEEIKLTRASFVKR